MPGLSGLFGGEEGGDNGSVREDNGGEDEWVPLSLSESSAV